MSKLAYVTSQPGSEEEAQTGRDGRKEGDGEG